MDFSLTGFTEDPSCFGSHIKVSVVPIKQAFSPQPVILYFKSQRWPYCISTKLSSKLVISPQLLTPPIIVISLLGSIFIASILVDGNLECCKS